MKTIRVNTFHAYDVIIGSHLLDHLGSFVSNVCKSKKICIISDSNVWPIYGDTASDSLKKYDFDVIHFTFPAGESSKNGNTYLQALEFLARNKMTRSDAIVALGGGVVGDLSGFIAATFLRGIPYIQVPTSLLSMVDSSVGGKTAIDLPSGKNLAGAFYQPNLVLCDIQTLDTLPRPILCDGCAEVIKYAILYDDLLFCHLQECGLSFDREYVISRCIDLKRIVVEKDEFDRGERQKLNLGHTVGHGVEAGSNFTVSHGQAVAIGTAIVTRAAEKRQLCADSLSEKVCKLLLLFELPISTEMSAQELTQYALSDKKRAGSTVNLIIPMDIGNCIIRPTPIEEIQPLIEAGL